MNQDPYSMCPCGSGKKLKFCCGDILPDLSRFYRLLENQRDVAEKLVRDLLQKYPGREVLVSEQWKLLAQNGKPEDARALLTDFLKRHPDHPKGLVWLARLCVSLDGFQKSRRIVHRALQISLRTCSAELSMLAGLIGFRMFADGEILSAREHLALALRLADPQERRKVMSNLAVIETDASIPLPLRTPWSLMAVDGSVALMEQDLRARKLSHIGCWEPAAILYSRMKEADPQNGAVWFNLALCLAWDGRSAEAAEALHTAAERLPQDHTAVEAEALAQLLDQQRPERQHAVVQHQFRVHSLSELYAKLNQNPVFASNRHFERDPELPGMPNGVERVATFDLLDRAFSDQEEITQLSQCPRSLGDVDLYDVVDFRANQGQDIPFPAVFLTVTENLSEAALATLRTTCGSVLQEPPQSETIGRQPSDMQDLECQLYRPESLSRRRFFELRLQLRSDLIDRWIDRPLLSLEGRTLRDAGSDATPVRKVAACALVLYFNSMNHDQHLDLTEICRKLGIAAPAPLTLSPGQLCAPLSAFQLERVDCASLSDAQLQEFCLRVNILGWGSRIKAGLDELLRRPAVLEQYGVARACLTRAELARRENDLQKAVACFQIAREGTARNREGFRERMEIEIREIAARLDDPHDPELVNLLRNIRDRYAAKVPEIVSVLQRVLLDADAAHLIGELHGSGTEPAEPTTLWTPGAATVPAEPTGKSLWLPGQS